jgi:hypothetical protein
VSSAVFRGKIKVIKKIFIIAGAILLLTAASGAAEENTAVEKDEPAAAKKNGVTADKKSRPAKEPTREELAESLKGMLENNGEIVNLIPELKARKDADGNVSYVYRGTSLEKLDDKTFRKLYQKTQSEAARIRTERLNRQLESIRQAQAAANAAHQASRTPRVVTPPPQPPRVPQPPPPTQIPKQPPQPPRK